MAANSNNKCRSIIHDLAVAPIRFSLTDDKGSAVRNETIAKLKEIGLENTKTGVWESASADITAIQKVLSEVLESIAVLSVDDSYPTILNHLWIYIDMA